MNVQMWNKTYNKKLVKVWQSGEQTRFEFWCGCTINTLPLWGYLMNSKNFVWTEDESHEKKMQEYDVCPFVLFGPFYTCCDAIEWTPLGKWMESFIEKFQRPFWKGLASFFFLIIYKKNTHYLNSMMITQWFNVGIGCISGLFNSCCISFIFCYIPHIKKWFYGYKNNSKIKPNKWKKNHQNFETTKLKKTWL
jgi:hypothetical protein